MNEMASEAMEDYYFNVEKEHKEFESVSEYLRAYENSEIFEEVLKERGEALQKAHPRIKMDRNFLIESTRNVPTYKVGLVYFYWAGNKLSMDLSKYPEVAQKGLRDYWDYIDVKHPKRVNFVKLTSENRDIEVTRLFNLSKERDRQHVAAALDLMGEDGIQMNEGDKIVCEEFYPEDEHAISLDNYVLIGRTLVSILTEEKGLDKVDINREEKKFEASLSYVMESRYKDGHYVAKGE